MFTSGGKEANERTIQAAGRHNFGEARVELARMSPKERARRKEGAVVASRQMPSGRGQRCWPSPLREK